VPTPYEADVLRRTLTELLKENEALRIALQVSTDQTKAAAAAKVEQKPAKPAPAITPPPPPAPQVRITSKRVLHTEARKVALARYRMKREKRIKKTAHLQGPKFMKYSKMKKVADTKLRNSEGKFIKKADRLAMEEAARLAEALRAVEPRIEIPVDTTMDISMVHQILVQ